MRGVSLQCERGVSTAWVASSWRGRGVAAAWNWRFALVGILDFQVVLVEVLCLVGGVTVDSFEERCQLVPPETKRKF